MTAVALAMVLLILPGCSALRSKLLWRARDVAFTPGPRVELLGPDQKSVLTVSTTTIQKVLLAHIRITRSARTQAELIIVEGDEPNAFAGLVNERRVIGINIAMMKFIGDDIDEFAALLGHETAHWAKGHVDAGNLRSNTIQGIGTLIGVGIAAAGVPAAGLITGLAADIVDASYSRDNEREADAASIDYMMANGFDPAGGATARENAQAARHSDSLLKQSSEQRGTRREFEKIDRSQKIRSEYATPKLPEPVTDRRKGGKILSARAHSVAWHGKSLLMHMSGIDGWCGSSRSQREIFLRLVHRRR
jgi:Zn-dependent protease with chaperone function